MYLNLLWLFVGHFVIDLTSSWIFFKSIEIDILSLIIIYNSLAFGTQFLFGLLVDKIKNPKFFCYLGLFLALLGSSLLFSYSTLALIIIGLANAVFHIGIGVIALNLAPHKTKMVGIIISSGAIGLLIGKLIVDYEFSFYLIIMLLLSLVVSLYFLKKPKLLSYQELGIKQSKSVFFLIISFLFIAIMIRGFVGLGLQFTWQSNIFIYLAVASVFFGKFFGGFLADHFGCKETVFVSLGLSALLFLFGEKNNYLSLLALSLFNIPMSVTLVALAEIMPRRPGLAFGLNCLALFFGLILFYFKILTPQAILNFVLILIAILLISISLLNINKIKKYE